eukprot:Blabericola_migrator_1__5519@NODE_2816_length_2322_cov_33_959645_g1766_i0_p2_GENE_NODE_2816_length_2322_cov_33_959645_g1766_i0NODE_2816_length_2322_cov_33_959645_g1766_i0_p2_ORF_typecomplete_len151_score15_87Vac_Fusion/PF02346_16/1_2e03Vac_Fusion/PF02346_16/0_74_NODE_2816_length_2322_cov_33_959645_g1766_i012031655
MPCLLRKVNCLISKHRRLGMPWSNHWVEHRSCGQNVYDASHSEACEFREAITSSTSRFTKATWEGFVQASWGRLAAGNEPTIAEALPLFHDRIQTRETEMLRRVRTASPQDLHKCSVLNEAQDALEREIDTLPGWVTLDPAHSRVTLLRK